MTSPAQLTARTLPFVGADELRASTPVEPDWLWQGYLAPGALTLLAGKPKAGKSTLAVAVSEAVARAASSFLGRTVEGGPVVYVSEESSSTLAHKLPATSAIRVLTRDAAWPKPIWPDLIAAARAEAKRVGAVLLVIDTWPYWAALPKDAEKDAGAVGHAMQLALDAARDGLAVLLPLHGRKGGGEDGEAVRGSGAIAGAADIVLELERAQRPTQRILLALSRYPSSPGSLIFDYDRATCSWSVVGEGERTDARSMRDRAAILDALRVGGELTRAELQTAIGAPELQWHAQLEELLSDGQVRRSGAGRKGDPYRFSMVRKDAARGAAQNPRTNAQGARSDSAAHPLRDAAESNRVAAALNGARCAASATGSLTAAVSADPTNGGSEGDGLAEGWTDDELQALIDAEEALRAEREASR